MSLARGTRLGPYEIIHLLGAGGMGEVYKARDTRVDRLVAVKVLSDHVASDPDRRARFEREARAVARLNHPHICTLFDVGVEQGVDFLVIEYLEGETLAARLQRGPLPLQQALVVAIEIADALDAAHRGGVIHRDLKPANVMLTPNGAKLLDFSIASLPATTEKPQTSSAVASAFTAEGVVVGTVHYMAPEQLEALGQMLAPTCSRLARCCTRL